MALSLNVLLNVLQCHPEIQEAMFEEIETQVGTDRAVQLEDKDRMPYCRAVILELLRNCSIDFGFPRVAVKDTTLMGMSVPKGTEVRL